MTVKQIADLIPAAQSLALVGANVQVAKKKDIKTKDILGLGVTNVVGASLIRPTSQLISDL